MPGESRSRHPLPHFLSLIAVSSPSRCRESLSRWTAAPTRESRLSNPPDENPAEEGRITARLPLDVTVHRDRFDETDITGKIDGYDRRRAGRQQYKKQRDVERFGAADFYGWSEDKAHQYAKPERADFGEFIRRKKFNLA